MMPSEISRLVVDSPAPVGEFGTWDVYPLFVNDTSRISDRRQTANTLYLSINSLLVGGIAFLAQQSGLASVSLLIVQVVIAIAGLFLTRQWLAVLELYRRLLAFRYEKLRALENTEGFPGAIKMFQVEYTESGDKKIFGFTRIEGFVPRLFRVLYIVGTLLLIAGTIAVKIHFGVWLSHYISIPPLQ